MALNVDAVLCTFCVWASSSPDDSVSAEPRGWLQVDDVDLPTLSGGAATQAIRFGNDGEVSLCCQSHLTSRTLNHILNVLVIALTATWLHWQPGKATIYFLFGPAPRLSPGAKGDFLPFSRWPAVEADPEAAVKAAHKFILGVAPFNAHSAIVWFSAPSSKSSTQLYWLQVASSGSNV